MRHSTDTMREIIHAATENMRWRILEKLSEGPQTAGELSKALDTSPQHVLWHLRTLTRVGLVRAVVGTSQHADKEVRIFEIVPQTYSVVLANGARKVAIKAT